MLVDGCERVLEFPHDEAAAFCDVSDGWIYRNEAEALREVTRDSASENI